MEFRFSNTVEEFGALSNGMFKYQNGFENNLPNANIELGCILLELLTNILFLIGNTYYALNTFQPIAFVLYNL